MTPNNLVSVQMIVHLIIDLIEDDEGYESNIDTANDLVLDTEQLRCTLLQPVANVDKNIRTRSILI